MSDIDPEVVRLIRELLIQTDKLGTGHQRRAQDIAHRLALAGKVISDRGSVPEWMERAELPLGASMLLDEDEQLYRVKADP